MSEAVKDEAKKVNNGAAALASLLGFELDSKTMTKEHRTNYIRRCTMEWVSSALRNGFPTDYTLQSFVALCSQSAAHAWDISEPGAES